HLFLSHLSRDNNDPELALQLFRQHAGDVQVHVAPRYGFSDTFHISTETAATQKLKQATLF
ncbi:MAG: MBL fold metallo-hydrolase, partial [Chitinophagaceae bacterium]|nr:MBL fold metallo-hydrolase [Chitinophagaceae bacterium]